MNADTGEFIPNETSDQIRSSWPNYDCTPLFRALHINTPGYGMLFVKVRNMTGCKKEGFHPVVQLYPKIFLQVLPTSCHVHDVCFTYLWYFQMKEPILY